MKILNLYMFTKATQRFIYVLALLLSSFYTKANNQVRFDHLKIPPEVSTRVECILEDSKGVMWFGTTRGLVCFDAYRMRQVENASEESTDGSFGYIHALVETNLNQIWIGTETGVFIYDKIKQTSKRLSDEHIDNCICRTLYLTSDNEVLLGTENGLYIYSQEGKFLESFLHQPELNTGLSHNVVRAFYEDQQKRIWIGTYDGLNCLDRQKKKLTRYRLQKADSLYKNNNLILSIQAKYHNVDSVLLVGTETGLCVFNTNTNIFNQYRHTDVGNSVSNNVIKTVCVDDSRIWLGTDLGLNLFSPDENRFENFYKGYKNTFSISNNVINQIYIDRQNNLWLATDNGIDKMYLKSNKVFPNRFYNESASLEGEFDINGVSEQNNGDIWLATSEGLICYKSEKDIYKRYLPNEILHNKVIDVFCDDKGVVWITSDGGLNTYNSKNEQFNSYVADKGTYLSLKNNYLNRITQSANGNIWIGSYNKGVYKVIKGSGGNIQFANFGSEVYNNNSLSSNRVSDIVIDNNDNVWVATNKGLNKIDVLSGIVEHYDVGVPSHEQFVAQLFIDKHQNLWLASNQGIFKTDLDNINIVQVGASNQSVNSIVVKDSFVYFTSNKGFYYSDLERNETFRIPNADIGLKSVSGIAQLTNEYLIVFGNEGFATINANEIKIDKRVPNVVFTRFSILNKEIKPYEKLGNRYVLTQNIDETDKVELQYSENTFQVEFSSLQYSHSDYCSYKYKLEGFDEDWITTNPEQAYVAYTQVRPGTYKLMVKASNKYGVFGDNMARELIIKIKPPMYLSYWAIMIYVLVLVSLFIISRQMLIARGKANNDIRFQKLQRQKSEELIEIKTRFFTNISHELRTPLTLITSPVDDLLSKETNEAVKASLLLVKRNTDRLKKLVNQILDIRKIETGGEKLSVQEYDIIRFCDRIISQFKEEADRRSLLLQYNTDETSLLIWFDMEKIEKVLINLISNALKFTPDGGCIRIEVKDGRKHLRKQNEVLIAVSDDGCGISKHAQSQIFDRFNTQSSPNYSNQQGTGIGLSLVKNYVEMHGGVVKVDSEPDCGSCFTFSIPLNKVKFGNFEEKIESVSQEEYEEETTLNLIDEGDESIQVNDNESLVALVVEDDHDMREYIISGLKEDYKVISAENGQQGLKMARAEMPDIIISDWMMAQMNGIELCQNIKSDLRTCHIPFILLTAKGGLESKLEGIETGADDYIQKPFNMAYLLVRFKNLMQQRERLRMKYQKHHELEPSEVTVTSLDEKFLSDLMELLENNMDNPELNVKNLSEKMGMSHTNMYRKIKALTGQTATEFIRTIRLKRAAQLLKNGQLNVTEVMYMVGFSHRSYFTQSFKAMYDVSPKEYK